MELLAFLIKANNEMQFTFTPERQMAADPTLGNVFARSHWIRLRTLIVLRWVAITGQLIAIAGASYFYDLQLEVGLCLLAIGAAIIFNLIAVFVYPENKRLSESEAMWTLLFDVCQLAFLLFLTGGLNNPFALLVMAPVTIASSALRLQSAVMIGMATIILATLLAFFFFPLRTDQGFILKMPDLFRFGFWVSIMIGVAFIAIYARRVSGEMNTMSDALLATQMALAREQKLTDLGGVIAAAAHELGTPLATIKLVSTELIDELKHDAALAEDAQLIREQADRCRDILRSMGRAGKDDLLMREAPLDSVLREAAEPHQDRGKKIHFDLAPEQGGRSQQPSILRRPEIIHGLRNLVQNAVDFSTANVWVSARWSDTSIRVTIIDDGDGFPQQMLGRIGDPYMSSRKSSDDRSQRPGYEGMGLGLFIAKTLLERTGAEMTFLNTSESPKGSPFRARKSGAMVEAVWDVSVLVRQGQPNGGALGENQPISVG
jgi:two-component system sensor histidine kinase RegB